jgi:hypothetical protein
MADRGKEASAHVVRPARRGFQNPVLVRRPQRYSEYRSPHAASQVRRHKTTRSRLEQQLQRAVLDHLAWRGVPNLFWLHIPNGGRRNPIEAAIFKGLGVVAGVPDLILIHGGHVFGLELKTEGGRLSPTQLATHEAMRAAGATVAVAYGIDAALEQLAKWRLLR